MKRTKNVLAVLVACVMLLCSVTAFASPKDEFMKLSEQNITKAAFTYDFGLQLDEPLSAALDETGEISEVLENFTFHTYGKLEMNDDYQQMKIQLTMELPEFMAAVIGETGTMDVWMDMDLSDKENPKMLAIMTDPVSGKYGYLDYTAVPGMMDVFTSMLDVNRMQNLNRELLESAKLPDDAYTKTDNGYRLSMTADQLKQAFGSVVKAMSGYLMTTMGTVTGQENISQADIDTALAEFAKMFEGVKLFGDPALVLDYTVDGGNVTGLDLRLAIDVNAVDIAAAFGETEIPLSREDANIKAAFFMSMDFTNVGEAQDITLPELTPENSMDMMYLPTSTVFNMNAINVMADGVLVTFPDAQPVLEGDRTFVPVRAISKIFGIADEDITYANGVVTIVDGGKTITLAEGVMEVTISEADNQTKLSLDAAPFNREDRVYVPLRFVNDALGGTTEWEPLFGNGEGQDATGSIVTVTTANAGEKTPGVKQVVQVLLPESAAALADTFVSQSKKIGVDCEVIRAADGDYIEKTMLVMAAGEPTMIFVPAAQAEQIGKFFNSHEPVLTDLTAYVNADNLTEEQKAAIVGSDGKIYAYPAESGVFIIPQTVENLTDCIALLKAVVK